MCLTLLCNAATADDDDYDDQGSGTSIEIVDGKPRLHIEPDALQRFGIKLAAPRPHQHYPETHVFGTVLETAPLRELRDTIRARTRAFDTAGNAVARQRELLSRFDRMRERGIAVDAIEAGREQRELERLLGARAQTELSLGAVREQARYDWGAVLGGALTEPADESIADLLGGRQFLVAVPVRDTRSVGAPVFVGGTGERPLAKPGRWLGPAVRNLAPLGTAYFIMAPDADLRIGMRVSVWFSRTSAAIEGQLVPLRALIWHEGAQWLYVEIEPGMLERRPVVVGAVTGGDAFIAGSGEKSGRVVVTGAPSLLGEEFRWSIPDEDDD